MKSSTVFSEALLIVSLLHGPHEVYAAGKSLTEKEKIEALIKKIEGSSDASFIRNGSTYDAKTAAKFLRGKWQAHETEIKTASDFIQKVGTASGTSGRPYLIRFKEKREVPCAEYLKEELRRLEKPE